MRRSAFDVAELLVRSRLRVFTTSDARRLTRQSPSATSRMLGALARRGRLMRLRRGLWADRGADRLHPYEAVPHFKPPWPAYVSLHSALSDQGVIAEIPHAIFAVSPANPRRYRTPLGEYRFHHLPSRLMWGFTSRPAGAGTYPIADPEKAFLDLLYLSLIPRSPLVLPPPRARRWPLDRARLLRYARRFGFPPLLRRLRTLPLG